MGDIGRWGGRVRDIERWGRGGRYREVGWDGGAGVVG